MQKRYPSMALNPISTVFKFDGTREACRVFKRNWTISTDQFNFVYSRSISSKIIFIIQEIKPTFIFRHPNSYILIKKIQRSKRLCIDKFALISEIWSKFINNSHVCYKPYENISIDKQLFPTKARCCFTQYMPNKLHKFSIKMYYK
ncbi:piggyBac transposable element-derived protein 4-like [Vespula squamosa]|uniref:PiggyBac transposable element-derived protein 4-like n=1 Tax=Vespula squamosa TaxID=30214 RepID=A0ABD2BGL3_VESSQ